MQPADDAVTNGNSNISSSSSRARSTIATLTSSQLRKASIGRPHEVGCRRANIWYRAYTKGGPVISQSLASLSRASTLPQRWWSMYTAHTSHRHQWLATDNVPPSAWTTRDSYYTAR